MKSFAPVLLFVFWDTFLVFFKVALVRYYENFFGFDEFISLKFVLVFLMFP